MQLTVYLNVPLLLTERLLPMNDDLEKRYLSVIEDIGPVMANSIIDFFAQEQTKDLITWQ